MKRIVGIVLIVLGLASIGTWFFAPADKARLARLADQGGISALTENPRKIWLLAGIGLVGLGSSMLTRFAKH